MDDRSPSTFKIPKREYLGGTPPAARETATNIQRTKLEKIYQAAENKNIAPTPQETPKASPIRTREDIARAIDQTRADQIPQLSKDEDITVPKSHLDDYHKAWQQYYQKHYENLYNDNLKNEVHTIKKRRVRSHLTQVATKDTTPETEKLAARKLHHEIIYKTKKTARRVKNSRHFRPILAALIAAGIVAFIQFNQLLTGAVAAFVAPSDNLDQPLLIASIDEVPVGPENILVIPKLGLESPLVFDAASNEEADMQAALENGVAHYNLPAAHSLPGEKGNAVFLGHSAGDIFYGGHYKYIFSKLNRLSPGDTFYINYNGRRYIYSVDRLEVINPTELDKLYIDDGNAWVTLITCDPPGSSARRLLVYAKQISPDPNADPAAKPESTVQTPKDITGKTPTLFERIFGY